MKQRYIVKPWVCDYGVWCTLLNEFVSIPLSHMRATQVAILYNKEKEGELKHEI